MNGLSIIISLSFINFMQYILTYVFLSFVDQTRNAFVNNDWCAFIYIIPYYDNEDAV